MLLSMPEPNDPRPMLQPQEISHAPEFAYKLSKDEAEDLSLLFTLTPELREQHLQGKTAVEIAKLFSQYLTMTKSVEANTRSFIEQFLLIQCDFTERQSRQINLPSISGALHGATMACKGPRAHKSMCDGCAFRQGTMANQSLITSTDAKDSVEGLTSGSFMCHEHTDDQGNPTQVCAGYAAKRKALLSAVSEAR